MKKSNDNFFAQVYQVVRLIPPGKVTTYGAIASYLGSKGSARMVGWAMNAAHGLEDVPAHRVVNRVGVLSGKNHFATPGLMQQLLEKEGVFVADNTIIDFENTFWDPALSLGL